MRAALGVAICAAAADRSRPAGGIAGADNTHRELQLFQRAYDRSDAARVGHR